ncbi:MAG: hypothetical protein KME18_23745 [Phormidium tanganyikae FI6-MK23]|nr:hypothetical protein [Phormidium tanganyikae FI6-MK23]
MRIVSVQLYPDQKTAKATIDTIERDCNQMLASLRIAAEHANSQLKVWHILAEHYRIADGDLGYASAQCCTCQS